jgi:hypothetical protein
MPRTVGRKSGPQLHLGCLEDGPDLVVLAMDGWDEGHPARSFSLEAHPEAVVGLSGESAPDPGAPGRRSGARATVATRGTVGFNSSYAARRPRASRASPRPVIDLRGPQCVATTDDDRRAALRETVCECGDGTPAGAVSWRGDAGCDKFGEVANGRFHAVLDGCAREVVAAEQEIDRLIRNEPARFEADVDHACVRARGKHGRTPAAHVRGEEALVMDFQIARHLADAPAVATGQSGLVAGLARDVAAGEEEIADLMDLVVRDDATTGRFDRVEGPFNSLVIAQLRAGPGGARV